MRKLIVALVLAGVACAACDVTPPTATTSSSSTPRASGSAIATRSATIAPAPTVASTTAPPPPAPTAPPPPPAQTAPTIKAIPLRGNRGTNFVFQFSGFPKSTTGLDIVQTVTLPTGVKLPSKTFSAAPDGSGLSTYTPTSADPSGQYVITLQVAGGGVSAFTIIIVD
jgi:hypothetical protein